MGPPGPPKVIEDKPYLYYGIVADETGKVLARGPLRRAASAAAADAERLAADIYWRRPCRDCANGGVHAPRG